MRGILLVAVAVAAIIYLVLPLVTGTTLRFKAFPSFEAITPDHFTGLAEPTREFFHQSSDELRALGFTLMAYGRAIKQVANISGYVMVFRKDPEQDWATVAHYLVESKDTKKEMSYVDLSTTHVDETVVSTSNWDQLPLWDPASRRHRFWLSKVRDLDRLYAIHRELVRQHGSGAPRRRVRDSEALTKLADAIQRELRDQETEGWLYLDPTTLDYRPTTKGAYRMTWRQMWP